MMAAQDEMYLVIWFEDGDVFTLTDSAGALVKKDMAELKSSIYGVLSSQDDIDAAAPVNRYAIRADLVREAFGWDV